jgi:hypothetical protein
MADFKELLKRRYLLTVLAVALIAALFLPLPAYQSSLRTDSLSHRLDFVEVEGRSVTGGFSSPYPGHPTYYRALFELMYGLETRLGLSPFGFRLLSALLVCLGALLAARLTTGLTGEKSHGLVAGILFALHPLVGYMILRPINQVNLLAVVLMLGAVGAFTAALRSGETRRRRWLWGLSLAAALAAMLTKEIALPLPGVIFLIALRERLKDNEGFGDALKYAVLRLLPFVGVLAAALLLRSVALGGLALIGEQGGEGLRSLGAFAVNALWPPAFDHLLEDGSRTLELAVFGLPFALWFVIALVRNMKETKDNGHPLLRRLLVHPAVFVPLCCLPLLVPLYGRPSMLDSLVFLPAFIIPAAWLFVRLARKRRTPAAILAVIVLGWFCIAGVTNALLWSRTSATNDRLVAALEDELPDIVDAGGYVFLNPPSFYRDDSCLTRINPPGVTYAMADQLMHLAPDIGYADATRWRAADPAGEGAGVDVDGRTITLNLSHGWLAPPPEDARREPVPFEPELSGEVDTLTLEYPGVPTYALAEGRLAVIKR